MQRILGTGGWIARLTVLLGAVLAAPGARAQDVGSFPFDRFSITAGSFFETVDTDVRLDVGTDATGTLISLEDDLGLDSSDQILRIEVEWRPFERSQLTAGYFELSREGRRTIDREIHFGDTVFPVSASVGAEADMQFAELFYTFWAVKRPRGGFGLNLGAAVISFDASLEAQVDRPGGPGTGTARREKSASTDLPVPLLGLEARYAITPRLLIAGAVRALPTVQIEDYEGSALSYGAQLEYRFTRHFGLGASWTGFNIEATVEKERFNGKVDFTVDGGQTFVRVGF